jgi:hypothetical protein
MSDIELWNVIWRALRMIELAIAKKYNFGEYRIPPDENVVRLPNTGLSDPPKINQP